MAASDLALFWAGVIAVSILAYVILDGFDLGVGILFGSTRNEDKRVRMMNTIAPFWDGNETWLIVIGALGYALLGAGWLTLKSEGALRDWAYARIPWLAAGVMAVLGLAFVVAMTVDAGAVAQSNLRERSWGLVFPILGVAALLCSVLGARARRDGVPFAMTALFFLSAYLTLGVMLWPFMIPYALTVANAAAPDASLQFLFYGVVVVLPVIVVYTIGIYWVFRGKVRRGYG